VRIGNAAASQFQLDIYGAILESIFLYAVYADGPDAELWETTVSLADEICAIWDRPDEGIWEVRRERSHFTHSKIMSWVGLDRASRLAQERGDPVREARWQAVRDEIEAFILEDCVDPQRGCLVQSAGDTALDASTLAASLHRFLPADDTVVAATIREIRKQLTKQGLVFRYAGNDGLHGSEGAFHLCTLWLIEALAMSGRNEEALEHFEAFLAAGNGLGLFPEESDPSTGRALGNFPQALTHAGLINSALALDCAAQRTASAWPDPDVPASLPAGVRSTTSAAS
jgi:GH15 family glucan-1,4-alpha-glucosidase